MEKEEFLNFIEKNRRLFKQDELKKILCSKFSIQSYEYNALYNSMIHNGEILTTKKGQVISARKNHIYKGKIIGNERGFAFCSVNDMPDFFISPKRLNGAMNGDIVLIKAFEPNENHSTEAEVIKILQKYNTTIVGTFFQNKKQCFVKPDNDKINGIIKVKQNFMARNGEKVVVKINNFDSSGLNGSVVEVLGDPDDLKTMELGIIRNHKLYEMFPDSVLEEVSKVPSKVLNSEIKKRVDLRNEITFTIDGEDARDFDDAISIEKVGKIYKLGVHIADVSHYVKEGSELDKEAYVRGTSVYFPNMVLPMLPTKLSNGICSLNENKDRLTLSVLMDIDENGKIIKHKICEAVINSKARLTYTDVYAVISGDKVKTEKYSRLKDKFYLMNELSKILETNRKNRGALDLDVPEPMFVLDENLDVIAVKKRERNDADKLIESFMIACNEVIAEHFKLLEYPFVYRVHEKPVIEKTKAVKEYLEGLGYHVPEIPKKINSEYYQVLLRIAMQDENLKHSLNKVILRSLQKAKYLPECLGHFGLASTFYCHFTAPIRRYSDLAIHRIIKESLNSKLTNKRKIQLEEFVDDASERASMMEKNADEAERDVDDLFKCIYIKKFIGDEFEGVISSVTNFGVFVELDNSIEGLIKIENLPKDTYLFFEKSLKLSGRQYTFSLGQKVKIKVVSSNLYERKIDFELVL